LRKVEDKEIMEKHMVERNIEHCLHAGKTPFGYLELGANFFYPMKQSWKLWTAKGAPNGTTNMETNHDSGGFHIML
jgi:hypothetical protein